MSALVRAPWRPAHRSLALAAIAAALVLGGCGGSSQVKAPAYAKSLCTALGNWKNTLQSAGVALQSSNPGAAPRPAAKTDYQRFVSALMTATSRAATDLRSAGTPSVAGGKQIADRLTHAFDTATHRLAQASTQARSIRTDSASTFLLGASAVSSEVKSALEGAIGAVALGRGQLRQAATREPACQVLQG